MNAVTQALPSFLSNSGIGAYHLVSSSKSFRACGIPVDVDGTMTRSLSSRQVEWLLMHVKPPP